MIGLVVFLLLVVVGIGVLVLFRLDAVQREQQARAARLNQAWRVMQALNRINAAHWQARQMMQTEAERHQDESYHSS